MYVHALWAAFPVNTYIIYGIYIDYRNKYIKTTGVVVGTSLYSASALSISFSWGLPWTINQSIKQFINKAYPQSTNETIY